VTNRIPGIWLDPRPAVLPETSVFRLPGYLRSQYSRIVVISHDRHLAVLDIADTATLIVSTDWLVWRRALEAGAHCIHYEAMLDVWPDDWGDPRTHHERVSEWVYGADGIDFTMFCGVSLGKHFVRNVTIFANAWRRVWHAIDCAIGLWKPNVLVLMDAHTEHDILDLDDKSELAIALTRKHGIRLENRLDVPMKSEGKFSERVDGYGENAPDPLWRRRLRSAYAYIVDMVFRMRWCLSGRPATQFIYTNFPVIQGLITAHKPGMASPLFLAATLPKSWNLLKTCWQKGVRLAHLTEANLTDEEHDAISKIEARITQHFAMRSDPFDQALGSFIQKRLIMTGWFRAAAAEVKSYLNFLEKNRVGRVVVGDVTGHIRIIAESASVLGIPADEMVNGMFVVPQRNDARCGDKGRGPFLDRILTWGEQNERWLESCAARVNVSRTGYPALDVFRRNAIPRTHSKPKTALVLPIYVDADDVMALVSNIFAYLVDTLQVLKASGVENIRVKLHVGPQDLDYYTDVARSSGVDCDVIKGGPIGPHLEWADIVVGPVNSGAYIEANAAGVPYYGFRPWPSLIDARLFDGMGILATPAELAHALATGWLPDRDKILASVASFDEISDSGSRTWRIVAGKNMNTDALPVPSHLQQSASS
jgi:hypothetical protein